MKNILTYLLVVVIVSQAFTSTIILTSFYINQDYIAKNQCENRFINAACKGSCVLMKRILEQEEKEQKSLTLDKKEVQLFVQQRDDFARFLSSKIDNLRSVNNHQYVEAFYSTVFLDSIFHPPLT